MKTLNLTGIATIAIIAFFATTIATASAAPRDHLRDGMREHQKEFRQDLTEDQIEVLEEARTLHAAGYKESAQALLEDHDIELPHHEAREEMKEQHAAVRQAIESGDYEAFQEATADAPVEIELTKEEFDGLTEIHELHQSGDKEAARELAEELGLSAPGKKIRKTFVENLTEDQQAILQEAHDLVKSGDKESAQALLEDHDIELPHKEKKVGFFKRFFKKNAK